MSRGEPRWRPGPCLAWVRTCATGRARSGTADARPTRGAFGAELRNCFFHCPRLCGAGGQGPGLLVAGKSLRRTVQSSRLPEGRSTLGSSVLRLPVRRTTSTRQNPTVSSVDLRCEADVSRASLRMDQFNVPGDRLVESLRIQSRVPPISGGSYAPERLSTTDRK